MARRKKKKIEKCCETCANLIAIGEGDHICDARPGKIILDNYVPANDYYCCGGTEWVEV